MITIAGQTWRPSIVRRLIRTNNSSTQVVHVETDQGEAFVKALGNPAGPHALACELVGTKLAKRLGLRTFDHAVILLPDGNPVQFLDGTQAQPGPAFVTRREAGSIWGGGDKGLDAVVNPDDINRLVVFDTWTRNCDRCCPSTSGRRPRPDNVFLSADGCDAGQFVIKAMDHTHCFDHRAELSARVATIDKVKEDALYGLFPAFRRYLTVEQMRFAVTDLLAISREEVLAIVNQVPMEWQVSRSAAAALVELLFSRARYVAENIIQWTWGGMPGPQGSLGFTQEDEQ